MCGHKLTQSDCLQGKKSRNMRLTFPVMAEAPIYKIICQVYHI